MLLSLYSLLYYFGFELKKKRNSYKTFITELFFSFQFWSSLRLYLSNLMYNFGPNLQIKLATVDLKCIALLKSWQFHKLENCILPKISIHLLMQSHLRFRAVFWQSLSKRYQQSFLKNVNPARLKSWCFCA
jgi:hypothetical protein